MKRLSLLLLIFLLSCANQPAEKEEKALQGDSVIDDTAVLTEPVSAEPLHAGDTLTRALRLTNGEDRVDVSFIVDRGDSLFARLSSADQNANIRITQIEMPDSTFDGPFGRDLKYRLKQHGKYKLIMGPNMMAGDPWSGDFSVAIWAK